MDKIEIIYSFLKKRSDKIRYFSFFSLITIFLLLLTVVYKNDQIISTTKKDYVESSDLKSIKKFLLKKIKSPFFDVDYKIKSGDSIQKILKKLNVEDGEIQKLITEYKKYGNPNQLLKGNIINIVISEEVQDKKKKIIQFSVPITESTTIEISKDESDEIVAKKIITKLYKKKVLAENIILNSLYKSAVDVKVNAETIIEFARIFGFEIDFQRDIRKNDYFKIDYDKYMV